MPGEHLSPGFFGKVPTTGDFVARGLPEDFVRWWDRFCIQHLVQPLAEAQAAGCRAALRFMMGAHHGGPCAGVVVASSDRVGRRFPLTVASLTPAPTIELPLMADAWFEAIEEAADTARAGELDTAGLERRLTGLPFPVTGGGEPIEGLVLWTDPYELHLVEPEAPQEALALLLMQPVRAA